MTKRDNDPHDASDPRSDLSTPGDPKDDHMSHYTSEPAQDRVGTQDKGIGGIQNQDDHVSGEGAQTFKGRDPLVTRDPDAFEHAPQAPAYAGAEASPGALGAPPITNTPASLSAGVAAMPGAGVLPGGMIGGVMQPDSFLAGDIDPNPGYTPPSEEAPTHPNEGAADLPAGAPGERNLEANLNDTVSGNQDKS